MFNLCDFYVHFNIDNRGGSISPKVSRFICSDFVIKKHRESITDFVRKLFFTYFGVDVG